jgi:hypothetical protein
VESAIRKPDAVEHITGGVEGPKNSVTLVTKAFTSPDPKRRFVLLIQALREGATLLVANAFRVYETDVDLRGVSNPEEVLVRFVNKYGLPFTYGSAGPALYMSGVYVPELDPLDDAEPEVVGEGSYVVEADIVIRRTAIGGAQIALGYIIDAQRYRQDLKKHGVDVPESYITLLKNANWGFLR